jgi:hypothetical protein
MSTRRAVPASLPSLFQSSLPEASVAEKYRLPLKKVRELGNDPVAPVMMSLTITVPAVVPSDFQSSRPAAPPATK